MRVVLGRNAILTADPSTFESLGGGYARVVKRTFYCGRVMAHHHASRLRWLGHLYATDGTSVFARGMPIAADAASFRVLGMLERRAIPS